MSLIRALKDQRNPYSEEGRCQEMLVDDLTSLDMVNESLAVACDALVRDVERAKKNLNTRRMRVIPQHLLESLTDIVRMAEERAQTIDSVIDLCYILKLDSVDLLDEFWQEGENNECL